ncbi:MAG: 2-octaprenyl-6-methoxyphenyl hydroxylase [Steroidobacterales bacterium]
MKSPAACRCDVAIVGGGMVGASLALALAGTRLKILLIEAVAVSSATQPSFDDRSTALGNGARQILTTLGVWEQIAADAGPIREIHISDAGHFGFARLNAAEHELAALGYTISNRQLGAALWRSLARCGRIELRSPARVTAVELGPEWAQLRVRSGRVTQATGHAGDGGDAQPGDDSLVQARLVVAADGAHSLVKQAAGIDSSERDYQQVALVANVRTDRQARGIAYERFTASGPLALLPLAGGEYAAVWTLAPGSAQAMRAADDGEFCQALQQSFGWRAGQILQVGRRASYPLALVRAERLSGERVALIGNAAQALHPVAAQGFNLGLRDAAMLAELIASASDPGSDVLLSQFAAQRAADRRGMIAFTDQLVQLFRTRRAGAIAARDLGLLLFDLSPPAKRALSRLSWGFGRTLPRLSRGLPLQS